MICNKTEIKWLLNVNSLENKNQYVGLVALRLHNKKKERKTENISATNTKLDLISRNHKLASYIHPTSESHPCSEQY